MSENINQDLTETQPSQEHIDIFEKQLMKHNQSNTVKILNLIYSFIVGVLTGFISKKYFRYNKIIGIVMALSSYSASKKFLSTDQ